MTTKHTPAPWNSENLIIKDSNGAAIAIVMIPDLRHENVNFKLAETNAKLMASAPELLEALIFMVDRTKQFYDSGDAGFFDCEEIDEIIKARSAIAKATT